MRHTTADQFDRLPPHSLEAETCVLGSLILGGTDPALVAEIRGELSADMFFQADHQILFDVICRLLDERGAVDGMILREELIRRQLLEEVGGIQYLAAILHGVPSPANGPHYASVVREKHGWRRLIQLSNDVIRQAYAPHHHDALPDVASNLASEAAALLTTATKSGIVSLGEAVAKVLGRKGSPQVRRIPTGIRSLDAVIGGLPLTKFTIVGADPRVGKSQLIKQILLNVARGAPDADPAVPPRAVGLVTVEEDREKVAENMLAAVSSVENNKIAHGNMSPEEWHEVEEGAVKLGRLPFYIEDSVNDLPSIRTAIQRLVLKYGCAVVAVDHIHIIDGQERERERELTKISSGLKQEFKRLGIAGIAAAQLNRGDRQQRDKPTLRNLRGSGALEADGDVIMLLHREDANRYNEEGYVCNRRLEVNVAKNKDGKMSEVPLRFDGNSQTIVDWIDEEDARWRSVPHVPMPAYHDQELIDSL